MKKQLLLSLLMLPLLCLAQNLNVNRNEIKDDTLSHNVKFVGKRLTWHSTYQMDDKNSILKKIYTCPHIVLRNNFGNRYNFVFTSCQTIAFDLLLNSTRNYALYFYVDFFATHYTLRVYDIFVRTDLGNYEPIYDRTISVGKKGAARLSAQLKDFFDIEHNKDFE